MSSAMVARLKLSMKKLQSLSAGIEQIAKMEDPINEVRDTFGDRHLIITILLICGGGSVSRAKGNGRLQRSCC